MVDRVEMNSFTSSSDARFDQVTTFLVWAWSRLPMLLVTFAFAMAVGEIYMQINFPPSVLYEFDSELGFKFGADQKSIVWQGNYSVPSPPIRINSESNRGPETDWSKKIVLAIGSSEVLGPGIEDDQTWAANLEHKLRGHGGNDAIEVVNAGTGGYGPFHHLVTLDRILNAHEVDTVIIRASVGDLHFGPPKDVARKSSLHKFLRDKTVFVRYLINKFDAQVRLIRRALIPFPIREKVKTAHTRTLHMAEKMWSENESYWMRSVEAAMRNQANIIFLVINPTDSAGETYLADRLSELCKILNYGTVLDLGAERFGLENLSEGDKKKVFEREFTLGYDPHANPTQHQIIAESLEEFLLEDQER